MSETHISKIETERLQQSSGAIIHGDSHLSKSGVQAPGLEVTRAESDMEFISDRAQKQVEIVKAMVAESEERDDIIAQALEKLKEEPRWPAKEAVDAFVADEQARELARYILSPIDEQ